MKKCKVCSRELPVSSFYLNRAKCKTCYCKSTVKYVQDNAERVRERATPYHRKRYQENALVRLKEKARSTLNRAVKAGVVAKLPCWCGNTAEAHHPHGYDKPLDVTWLCKLHHTEVHYGKKV